MSRRVKPAAAAAPAAADVAPSKNGPRILRGAAAHQHDLSHHTRIASVGMALGAAASSGASFTAVPSSRSVRIQPRPAPATATVLDTSDASTTGRYGRTSCTKPGFIPRSK